MNTNNNARICVIGIAAILSFMPVGGYMARSAQTTTREQRLTSFMIGCKRILDANPSEKYLMTDLNGNGFPEMWVSYNVGRHADNCWHVYHSENGKPAEVFKCPYGAIENYGGYVLVEDGNGALRLTYDGNSVYSTWQSGRNVSNEATTTHDRTQFHNYF